MNAELPNTNAAKTATRPRTRLSLGWYDLSVIGLILIAIMGALIRLILQ